MKATVYNQAGKETGKTDLPEGIFGIPWNGDLVHQVVSAEQANLRAPIAHAKGRGEVRGGGKKPWRQKGTGRARHGSIRSPLWTGGGVTHGPTSERNFSRKVNKKMKAKALYAVLSDKLRNSQVLLVDSLELGDAKTKNAAQVLKSLAGVEGFQDIVSKRKNAALLALPSKDRKTEQGFANISNVAVSELRNLTPLALLQSKYFIFVDPDAGVKFLGTKTESKKK